MKNSREMDIASILRKYPKRREFVLEILHEIQNHDSQQHLTEEALRKVAQHLNLPLSQIYGIAGYYTMFSIKPRGKFLIQVCRSPVCSMMGSESIVDSLKSLLRSDLSNSAQNPLFTIEEVECLGQCSNSPCMMINQKLYGNLTSDKIELIIADLKSTIQKSTQQESSKQSPR
jgi:NADH-quinone oxidoreductase subunit E